MNENDGDGDGDEKNEASETSMMKTMMNHGSVPLLACCWFLLITFFLPVSVIPFTTVRLTLRKAQPLIIRSNPGVSLRLSEAAEEAKRLRQEAERIRKDISSFEKTKEDSIRAEEEVKQQLQAQKQQVRKTYSAEVPILKGNGQTRLERVDFPPRFAKDTSRIATSEASLPLGIILGEHEEIPGAIRVDEVVEGGNGDVSGVKEGDLLRACTACQTTMETPTWQLLAGGIGQPKTKRFMYSTDGRPFEEVMDAVASNRMDPEERPVVLVLERRDG